MAKLTRQGSPQAQLAIMSTAQACKSKGVRGERLGACVPARDDLAVTPADPAGKGERKGKEHS